MKPRIDIRRIEDAERAFVDLPELPEGARLYVSSYKKQDAVFWIVQDGGSK